MNSERLLVSIALGSCLGGGVVVLWRAWRRDDPVHTRRIALRVGVLLHLFCPSPGMWLTDYRSVRWPLSWVSSSSPRPCYFDSGGARCPLGRGHVGWSPHYRRGAERDGDCGAGAARRSRTFLIAAKWSA